jgi:DNA-binding NtrC family response regulator
MDSILIIEDREALRQTYALFLRKQGYGVREAASVDEARSALGHHRFDLILSDYLLPGTNGLDFLSELRERADETPVIIMTAFGEVALAVDAMRRGAFDFLEKPVDLNHLAIVIGRALEHQTLKRRDGLGRVREGRGADTVIGESEAMRAVIALADKVAASDTTCLLLGESGVGKEVLAQYLHARCTSRTGPLVSLSCASIPRELMESELFGHEKGAFTGALSRKVGLVEMADGGTLFLDEIGELPLDLQPKLLRFIQERELCRIGSTRTIRTDVRLICATNRDLEQGAREGWFREDLYYRLAVFPIEIPPLRHRPDDLEALIPFFLARHGCPADHLPPDLLSTLKQYTWPGNVRELENVLERAVILSGGGRLGAEHFPDDLLGGADRLPVRLELDMRHDLRENLQAAEAQLTRSLISAMLREENGRREPVARRLGISIKTLYNKITQLDIAP